METRTQAKEEPGRASVASAASAPYSAAAQGSDRHAARVDSSRSTEG
jgi:hypothetical protein